MAGRKGNKVAWCQYFKAIYVDMDVVDMHVDENMDMVRTLSTAAVRLQI